MTAFSFSSRGRKFDMEDQQFNEKVCGTLTEGTYVVYSV